MTLGGIHNFVIYLFIYLFLRALHHHDTWGGGGGGRLPVVTFFYNVIVEDQAVQSTTH